MTGLTQKKMNLFCAALSYLHNIGAENIDLIAFILWNIKGMFKKYQLSIYIPILDSQM